MGPVRLKDRKLVVVLKVSLKLNSVTRTVPFMSSNSLPFASKSLGVANDAGV